MHAGQPATPEAGPGVPAAEGRRAAADAEGRRTAADAGTPSGEPHDDAYGRPKPTGPVGVSALLAAVRAVPGVRDAQVRTSADGDRTLRLDLADGADGLTVAALVSQVLDERLGVVVDPARSVLVEDASAEEEYRAPVGAPRRRVLMERLQVVTGGLDASVDVGLASAETKVVGTATGPAVEAAVLRTVATATLNAVDALIEGRGRCGLDQAEVTEIGSDRVAVAVVTLLTPGRVDRLVGAALVRGDARQAMARAVLAALNRRLESLLPERPPPEAPGPDAGVARRPVPVEARDVARPPPGEIVSGVGWPDVGGTVNAVPIIPASVYPAGDPTPAPGAAPTGAAPAGAAPDGGAPDGGAPGRSAAGQSTPAYHPATHRAPVEIAPVDEAPVGQAPVDGAPVDAAPVDAAPVQHGPVNGARRPGLPAERHPARRFRPDAAAGTVDLGQSTS